MRRFSRTWRKLRLPTTICKYTGVARIYGSLVVYGD